MREGSIKEWTALWSTTQHGGPFKPVVKLSSMVNKSSYPYSYRLVGHYDRMILAQEACMEAVYTDTRGGNKWRTELEFF